MTGQFVIKTQGQGVCPPFLLLPLLLILILRLRVSFV